MFEARLPRKIVGINRKSESYALSNARNPNNFDEYFHEFTNSISNQDLHSSWNFQVFIPPKTGKPTEHLKKDSWDTQKKLQNDTLKTFTKPPHKIHWKSQVQKKGKGGYTDKHIIARSVVYSNLCTSVDNSSWGSNTNIQLEGSKATRNALRDLFISCTENGKKVAQKHPNRPFFKKIDILCCCMQTELIHPDSVAANIHSKGVVWAIKDFVFVCSRIINAWNKLKDYMYDQSEGLRKVQSSLSSDFKSSFIEWQKSNLKLIDNLMMSFLRLEIDVKCHNNASEKEERLDKLNVLMEGLRKENSQCNNNCSECGCSSCEKIMLSQSTHDALKTLSISCSEYGVEVAKSHLNLAFFRKVDSLCERTRDELFLGNGALSNVNSQGIVWTVRDFIFICTRLMNAWNIIKGYVYDSSEALDKIRLSLSPDFVPSFITWQETTLKLVSNVMMSFLKLDKLAHVETKGFKTEEANKNMMVLTNRLMQLNSANVFFKTQFCRNYFPDFIDMTPAFNDLRTIILKTQGGEYSHIFETIHDIRHIIYQGKTYLMKHPNPLLANAITAFQKDVDKILTEDPFESCNFCHIEGKPNEIIFF